MEEVTEHIDSLELWLETQAMHKGEELEAKYLSAYDEALAELKQKSNKNKGLKMITTLLLLTALAVSVYMNYKRGVTFTDVVTESKELFNKTKEAVNTEDESEDMKVGGVYKDKEDKQ